MDIINEITSALVKALKEKDDKMVNDFDDIS